MFCSRTTKDPWIVHNTTCLHKIRKEKLLYIFIEEHLHPIVLCFYLIQKSILHDESGGSCAQNERKQIDLSPWRTAY